MFPPAACTEEAVDEHITGIMMASYSSLKKGIERFGDKAEKATTKELQQTHNVGLYEQEDTKKFTNEEKCDALESLLFNTPKKG